MNRQFASISSWLSLNQRGIVLFGLGLIERRLPSSSQVWPLSFSLIVKKVTSETFRFPCAFPNLPLFRSISALSFFSLLHRYLLFRPPFLSAPDQLIMSEKEGHYPEVISWVLSGWCISAAWWRNTLLPERLPSSSLSFHNGRKQTSRVAQVHCSQTKYAYQSKQNQPHSRHERFQVSHSTCVWTVLLICSLWIICGFCL